MTDAAHIVRCPPKERFNSSGWPGGVELSQLSCNLDDFGMDSITLAALRPHGWVRKCCAAPSPCPSACD